MILRIDHLGIAVRSIDERLPFWAEALGLTVSGREAVPTEGVRVAFLPAGESRLELLEPAAPDSAIARHLERRGEGLHHVTLAVADLDGLLDRLRRGGVEIVGGGGRPGAGGHRVAFLHPRSTGGVLLELLEDVRQAEAPGAPGFERWDAVLAYLGDPPEKLWGVLHRLDGSGIVIEGLDLNSFDDWIGQVERGEPGLGPSVLFLPMRRVEKLLLDRRSGELPSLSDRFEERVGRTVQQVLGIRS
jgi:methylmalonyl-CoA/ethylmalonyl-CoA epimerase